jgi:hypothetical protein
MNNEPIKFPTNENALRSFNNFRKESNSNCFLNPKLISKKTPSTNNASNLSYFSRVNTSPAKVKNFDDESKEFPGSKAMTLGKTVTRSQNIFLNEEAKDNHTNAESKFSYHPKCYKPSLNSTESHHKVLEYSKTKRFEEDQAKFSDRFILENEATHTNANSELNISVSNLKQDEEKIVIEEPEYSPEELAKMSKNSRLLYYESRLPVPINKKDDEKFKLLKMKEMKRESLPAYKSAQTMDFRDTPKNQKEFKEGNNYFYLRITVPHAKEEKNVPFCKKKILFINYFAKSCDL